MRPEDAARMLTAIGLSSVPTWLRPYRLLSNGEQYRARMAKMISECQNDEILLVDEYTSVVDRNVAKSMSYALQKYIRRTNKRIIVFSCHFDIFDWLQPDWIYDLNKGGVLEKNVYLRQRPTVELQVFRVSTDTWAKFKKTSLYDRRIKRGRGLFRVRMGKQIGCVRKRFANAVGRVFKWVS
jgi:energy-coupling factor transporter ATP-binding protein EcfA2